MQNELLVISSLTWLGLQCAPLGRLERLFANKSGRTAAPLASPNNRISPENVMSDLGLQLREVLISPIGCRPKESQVAQKTQANRIVIIFVACACSFWVHATLLGMEVTLLDFKSSQIIHLK
jgi:hypothetical protein